MAVPDEIKQANDRLLEQREKLGIPTPTLPTKSREQEIAAALFPPESKTGRLVRGEGSDCSRCGVTILPEEEQQHARLHADRDRRKVEAKAAEEQQSRERAARLQAGPLNELVPGISKDHGTAKLTDFSPKIAQPLDEYLSQDEIRGVFISGPAGTGKTRLSAAICREFLVGGWDVQFTLARSLFRRIWNTYRDKGEETEEALMRELKGVGVLAIDDLGHEGKVSDAVVGALHEILAARHDNFRPTVITSNLNLKEIAELYDASIASRIGNWFPIVMAGKDRRGA